MATYPELETDLLTVAAEIALVDDAEATSRNSESASDISTLGSTALRDNDAQPELHVIEGGKEEARERVINAGLTTKELEILNHLGNGLPNAAIAEKCAITEQTVKSYLKHVFSKLNVTSRVEAAILAAAQENKPAVNFEVTDKEAQVLALIAQGHTNSEAAVSLRISLDTVKNRLKGVYDRTTATNRTEAALLYVRSKRAPKVLSGENTDILGKTGLLNESLTGEPSFDEVTASPLTDDTEVSPERTKRGKVQARYIEMLKNNIGGSLTYEELARLVYPDSTDDISVLIKRVGVALTPTNRAFLSANGIEVIHRRIKDESKGRAVSRILLEPRLLPADQDAVKSVEIASMWTEHEFYLAGREKLQRKIADKAIRSWYTEQSAPKHHRSRETKREIREWEADEVAYIREVTRQERAARQARQAQALKEAKRTRETAKPAPTLKAKKQTSSKRSIGTFGGSTKSIQGYNRLSISKTPAEVKPEQLALEGVGGNVNQIIQGLIEGSNLQPIAHRLGLSEQSLQRELVPVMRELGARTPGHLVRKIVRKNLGQLPFADVDQVLPLSQKELIVLQYLSFGGRAQQIARVMGEKIGEVDKTEVIIDNLFEIFDAKTEAELVYKGFVSGWLGPEDERFVTDKEKKIGDILKNKSVAED